MATALLVFGIRRHFAKPSTGNVELLRYASPNFGARRGGVTPDLIVLHYTAMATAGAAIERLCDPACEVSAHYLIEPGGQVVQLVEEDQRAWHAGAGSWGGCHDVNSQSIGIELANDGLSPFGAAQMDALEGLMVGIMGRWPIPPERVIAHSDMAPARKSDPGARFDWQRLARQHLSVWPTGGDANPPDPQMFADLAATFGYPRAAQPDHILAAFRLRFRPWDQGPLDAIDMGLIGNLARRFPVDQTGSSA